MELIMVTMWSQYHLSVIIKIIVKPTELMFKYDNISMFYLKYL